MSDPLQITDLARETFAATAKEHAPELSSALIEQAYLLQKKHQFDATRDMSVQALLRAIEEYVTPERRMDAGK